MTSTPTLPTDATLLQEFESWLRLERGLSGVVPSYVRCARLALELVPRADWEGLDATRIVVESVSLSQRNLTRSGLRRFSEFLAAKHGLTLTRPTGPKRGAQRRVPPSSVILGLAFLADRIAPSILCILSWRAPQMDGSLLLPDGHTVPGHPEVLYALAELALWRPPHGADDALVPTKSGGHAPSVSLQQLRRWLRYKNEAQADKTAVEKIRAAFDAPEALSFPCFSRGARSPAATAHAPVVAETPERALMDQLGILDIPAPKGPSFPNLDAITAHVGGEE